MARNNEEEGCVSKSTKSLARVNLCRTLLKGKTMFKRLLSTALLLSMLISMSAITQGNAAAQEDEECGKPRTVVMHDPELDDQNTLIRYMLYANNFDTQGLVYQSSGVHWKGDDEGTVFEGSYEGTRFGLEPRTNWRWEEDESFIEDAVEIYAEVYPNLIVHEEGFPEPEELRSRIYEGNIEFPRSEERR